MEKQTFNTVQDLIVFLIPYQNRTLIWDDGGNTYDVDTDIIDVWNENDPESPIAIYNIGGDLK